MIDKYKILAGRKAVDTYRAAHALLHSTKWHKGVPEAHTPLLNTMLAELKKQGFNSLDEFYKANETVCYSELKRCYTPVGVCDACEGRTLSCLDKCFLARSAEFNGVVRITWRDFYDWQSFEGNTPPTCSIHFEKITEPNFDVINKGAADSLVITWTATFGAS